MNLIIDIGNSLIKTAVFNQNEILEKNSFLNKEFSNNLILILKKYNIDHTILSSVGKLSKNQIKVVQDLFTPLVLSITTKLPFVNKYETPETLGVDRIALVAAAVNKFPSKNVLIIDAGSCVTFDFVNFNKEYYGGAISPGIEMRYKAIHTFTANLPELSRSDTIPEIGNTTKNAIHLGVENGIIQEIEGVIHQYKAKYSKLTIVLTGGDTIFLAKNIKSTIFANPNFLLEGLNSILIYNIDE